MTLLDNKKRQKVMIKNMRDKINAVKKIYKDGILLRTLTEEQKEKSWQGVFNENKIIEQLAVFENNNEYLTVNATYLAIMMQYTYKYLKWISVFPNMDWYFYVDEQNKQTNDLIQCIVPNCPHKNKAICFMSWVPSNKPHIIHKYRNIMNKEYYADRAYIMPVCDLHYYKWLKDESKVMNFMLDTLLPLRKYEDKNGFVVLPDMGQRLKQASEQMSENFNKIGKAANDAAEQITKVVDTIHESKSKDEKNNI